MSRAAERKERLRRLTPEQRARLLAELAAKRSEERRRKTIRRREAAGPAPLSFQQQRLWFISRIAPRGAYNIGLRLDLLGPLDAAALQRGLGRVEHRHEILRTVYRVEGEALVQEVSPPQGVALPRIDLGSLGEASRAAVVQRLGRELADSAFDLESGPLLRLLLLMGEPGRASLLCSIHHILFDGWSQEVLIGEMAALYEAEVRGEDPNLPELALQYADYATWQRERLSGAVLEGFFEEARQRFAGAPALLELPTDRPRPAVQSFLGSEHRRRLPRALRDRLLALSREREVTLFMLLAAAFQTLLFRLSGQSDLLIGTPSTQRQRPELEALIGCFVQTVVLRQDMSGDPTFEGLLRRVRDSTLEAFDQQELPFEAMLEALEVERAVSHSPLFQVLFVLQNAPQRPASEGGLEVVLGELETGTSKFDLNLGVAESPSGLDVALEFDRALFDSATIQRWLDLWQALLVAVCEAPERRLSQLPMLLAPQRQALLREWNDTPREWAPSTVPEAILRQAQAYPAAPAVQFGDEVLDYGELLRGAAAWGRLLRRRGVVPGDVVGVHLQRSLELPVALLACWWAGAAYLPIEPSLPPARRRFLVETARCRALLSGDPEESGPDGVPCLVLDRERLRGTLAEGDPRTSPAFSSPLGWSPESLAYLIFTSGSTGRPKGVMVPHGGLWNRLRWMQEEFDLQPEDRVGQKTPFGFDVSVWEFFWPLMQGASLVLARPEMHRDSGYLVSWAARRQISILHFVPSMLRFFVAEAGVGDCRSLRQIICSGEALPAELAQSAVGRWQIPLANLYGPTEASIDVTAYHCRLGDTGVPIGRPISNTACRIVDANGELVALGAAGELCLGGQGLARGYAGQPALTASRFVPDPWALEAGQRLYRTGDLVRHLPDGQIDYLGRLDFQVKVRGFRIELGEIERCLGDHAGVEEAVVIATEEAAESRLVAYFVSPGEAPTTAELRRHLAQWLPDYMVPAVFVPLPELPLSPNGKLDRRSLPAPGRDRPDLERVFAEPRTPVEISLAELFGDVLGLETIGIDDSFFALGGDSMRGLQATTRALARGIPLELQDLYRAPTIRQLAERAASLVGVEPVEAAAGAPFSLISIRDRERLPEDVIDAYPLAQMQAGMLYHMELAEEDILYHNVDSWHLRLDFDLRDWLRALRRQVKLHEVLRTSFDFGGAGEALQRVHERAHVRVPLIDLQALGAEEQEDEIRRFVRGEKRRAFDLSQPPLLRFHVHRRAPDRVQLTLTENHAVWDGWSLHSSLAEIFGDYLALRAGESLAPLRPPPVRYRDFVELELAALESPETQRYWRAQVAEWTFLELPPSRDGEPSPGSPGRRIHQRVLRGGLFEALEDRARALELPVKSLLLAAHCKVLSLITGQREVTTGLVSNGRPDRLGGDRARGLFLNTLPFRLALGGEAGGSTWVELSRRAFQAETEMVPHRRFPLARIQRMASGPLFEQAFNYLHFHAVQEVLEGGGLEVLGMEKAEGTSQALMVVFDHQGLQLEFDGARFSDEAVDQWAGRYERVLRAMASDPEARHGASHFLAEKEELQVLRDWSLGGPAPERPESLLHGFRRQAMETPDRVALVEDGLRSSYRELEASSRRLALELRQAGVHRETRVAVSMERKPAMVVALLAILRAGGTYVALDPSYPVERNRFVLARSAARLLLSDQPRAAGVEVEPEVIAEGGGGGVGPLFAFPLSAGGFEPPESLPEDLPEEVSDRALAYILFTSGSTGRPKGVAIPHAALSAFLAWGRRAYRPQELAGTLASTSINFDLSIFELFLPLVSGGAVVIAPNALHLPEMREAWRVTLINSVPSIVAELLHSYSLPPSVGTVNLAGEAFPRSLADRLFEQRGVVRVSNLYGPSEDTTYSTWHEVRRDSRTAPAIGRSLPGSYARVLDPWGQPAPPGVPGSLALGGTGLARGYLDQPRLTAERFVPAASAASPGERLYLTGDLARWRDDGELEFLGRSDQQIKLRGFRIELGEIEQALDDHPRLAEQVVVLRSEDGDDPRIVAYGVPEEGESLAVEELHAFLEAKLPSQMIPTAWVLLPRLPRTPNGKIDRLALPAPGPPGGSDSERYAAPRGVIETSVAALWASALGIERVGRSDEFFALGGHSLLATRIVGQAREVFDLELPLGLLFKAPTVAKLAREIEGLRRAGNPGPSPLEPGEAGERMLSFAQERLWALMELNPGDASYNLPLAAEIEGVLSLRAMSLATEAVGEEQRELRTQFATEGGRAIPRLLTAARTLPLIDLSGLGERGARRSLQALIAAEAGRPFALAKERPWRSHLVRISPQRHAWLTTLHHIVGDAASLTVLLRSVARHYREAEEGGEARPVERSIHYADFAAWQRGWLRGDLLENELAYWRRRLEGAPERLELPADRPRPGSGAATGAAGGAGLGFVLDGGLREGLGALARDRRATPFMTCLALFQILLERYSGQRDLVVGVPASHRDRPELDDLVGLFVNSLCLRLGSQGARRFSDLLDRVRERALEAYAHRLLPFDRLVDELRPARDLSTSPLFQVFFDFQPQEGSSIRLGGLRADILPIEAWEAKFELTMSFRDRGDELAGFVEYRGDLFDPVTIERMVQRFRLLAEAVVDDPEIELAGLSLLSAAERRQLESWSTTPAGSSAPLGLLQRFDQVVAATPHVIAAVDEDSRWTFGGLDSAATRLAARLGELGLAPEDRVGLLAGRSAGLLVGILGILRAGAAFVPLDPALPTRRLEQLLGSCKARALVVAEGVEASLQNGPRLVPLEDVAPAPRRPVLAPRSYPDPRQMAYVLFTSGSTGRPKGVAVEHEQIAGYCQAFLGTVPWPPSGRFAMVSTASADLGYTMIFGALATGGQVLLLPESASLDPLRTAELLTRFRPDCLKLVPSHLNALLALPNPRSLLPRHSLILGGEALSGSLVQGLRRSGFEGVIVNEYGPTETTIGVIAAEVGAADLGGRSLPIGRPYPGTRIRLLDAALRPTPPGLPGEIWVGGIQISRGYLHQPAETAAHFLPDAAGRPGERLYRTGDRARYLQDGRLEFLGRMDLQVKIRGYRVEPGEVESTILESPEVRAAVVMPPVAGTAGLVAYLVLEEGATLGEAEIRSRLQAQLPEAMVPSAFLLLDRLPLNANGKVDRGALPRPDALRHSAGAAPATQRERLLREIWREVLGVDQVALDDNFFAIGGDSIMGIQIAARAAGEGLKITGRMIFQHQTLRELALAATPLGEPVDDDPVAGPFPLTPIQARFFALGSPAPEHANQAVLVSIDPSLRSDLLERALNASVRAHAALRTRFLRRDGLWEPEVVEEIEPYQIPTFDLSRLGQVDRERQVEDISGRLQAGLDLAAGRLMTLARFLFGGDRRARLLIAIHHLAVDGVSWRILVAELTGRYHSLAEGRDDPEVPHGTVYSSWARRLQEYARTEEVAVQRDYWRLQLESGTTLPTDFAAPAATVASAASFTDTLSEADTEALQRVLAQASGLRPEDLFLTALVDALAAWTGDSDWMIELEGHGRSELFEGLDLSRTVGWFTAIYPLRLESSREATAIERLQATRQRLRSVPGDGLGYGLLRYLGSSLPFDELREPEILFNYLGQLDGIVGEESLFGEADESCGAAISPQAPMEHRLTINAWRAGGVLRTEWTFSRDLFRRRTLEALARDFRQRLRALVAAGLAYRGDWLMPSDLPWAGVDSAQLDSILATAPGEIEDVFPLSPLQQGLLFHALAAEEEKLYHEQVSCLLVGELDVQAFTEAWRTLVARHGVLRTSFHHEGLQEPLQAVHRPPTFAVEVESWADLGDEEKGRRLEAYLARDLESGFSIVSPPLMRVALFTWGGGARLVWSRHHILMDGWSVGILIRELLQLYEARRGGQEAALPAAYSYRGYIQWARRLDLEAAERFWKAYLSGFDEASPIPAARLRTKSFDPDERFEERSLLFSPALGEGLTALARSFQVTLNTLFVGLWSWLLHKHGGEEDVVFGMVTSGRPPAIPEIQDAVGLFINTLPMRVRLSVAWGVEDWLRGLQEQQTALMDFELSPLLQIQRWSEVPPGAPLFDSLFVFENYPAEQAAAEAASSLEVRDVHFVNRSNYPLTVVVGVGTAIAVRLRYDRSRIEGAGIQRLAAQLEVLAADLVRRGPSRLGELAWIPAAERAQVLEWSGGNRGDLRPSAPPPVHLQFLAAAEARPNSVAVVCEEERLSYAALEARSRELALRLVDLGVGAGDLVAILAERRPSTVVALLAVLRAAAAYLPLDPAQPEGRLHELLEDSGARCLLVGGGAASALASGPQPLPVLPIAPLSAEPLAPTQDSRPLPALPDAASAAYLLYTSGSTGRPKGVCVEHRQLSAYVEAVDERLGLAAGSSYATVSALSADLGNTMIFGALTRGGTLHILTDERLADPEATAAYLDRRAVDCLKIVPSHLRALLSTRDPHRLLPRRLLMLGGEELGLALVASLRELSGELGIVNHYGPTETTIGVSTFRLPAGPPPPEGVVPIGRPLGSARISVIGRSAEPLPVGVPGELLIGGASVARGYAGQPALTAERFVPDPTAPGSGARAYRSGDLGRWNGRGELEFLGRIDQQIKIRGYRVEPGEIEAALARLPTVQRAAVGLVDARAGSSLVAWVVPTRESGPASAELSAEDFGDELREALAAVLPGYMVPASFVVMTDLPLNANGKLDRRRLPDPQVAARESVPEPMSRLERDLRGVWQEVLGEVEVGREDDFFALGGHSLRAMVLVNAVQERLGRRVPLSDLFEAPTLAGMATRLETRFPDLRRMTEEDRESRGSAEDPWNAFRTSALAGDGPLPLSFAQQQLWFEYQLDPANPAFNIGTAIELEGELRVARLSRAFAAVLARHESLRTRFGEIDGEAVQRIEPAAPFHSLAVVDLGHLPAQERRGEASRRAAARIGMPFDLEGESPIRLDLLRLGEGSAVAVLSLHHIVADGWSLGILLRELAAFYNRQEASLPEIEAQYRDFVLWQRRWLAGETLQSGLEYWKEALDGAPDLLRLPTDRPRSAAADHGGSSEVRVIDAHLTAGLRRLAESQGASLFMVAMAAFQALLAWTCDQEDVVVGSDIAGRNRAELEGVIGFFINQLPLRSRLAGDPTFRELLAQVRSTVLDAFAHQEIPFERIVGALRPARIPGAAPLFQAKLNLQTVPESPVEMHGLQLSLLDFERTTAQLDLILNLVDEAGELEATLQFRTDLFDPRTARSLLARYERLLRQAVNDPEARLSRLARSVARGERKRPAGPSIRSRSRSRSRRPATDSSKTAK